jgi:anti-sigma regulatory factor (Ser/Thr protein kinase)
MRTEPAAATRFTGTYPGRAEQVHHVRRAVAKHLAGCPAADDTVLIASELASNAIVHSASRGERHPHYVWIEAEDRGGPGAARSPMTARTAWTWSKRSPDRTAGASRAPPEAAGSSGRAST